MNRIFFLLVLCISQVKSFSQIDATSGLTNGSPIFVDHPKVTITPPENYKYLKNISSFIDRNTESSISIIRNDSIPYYMTVASLLRTDFAAQKITLLNKEELTDKKGMIFTFLMNIQDVAFERMVYVTGNDTFTILTSANYKQSDKEKLMNLLRVAILSVTY